MPSTLRSPVVANVLRRLHAQADDEDSLAAQRVRAREVEIGHRLVQDQRYELYGEAPLSITPEVGQLLYLLALSTRPRQIVEFGSSLGVSTIYLAAAIRDCGSGTLITSEYHAQKVKLASQNLADAGLADLVELRSGDALERWRTSPSRSTWCSSTGATTFTCRSFASSSRVCCHLASWSPTSAPTIEDLLPYLEYVREPAWATSQ